MNVICDFLNIDKSPELLKRNFFALGGSSITSVCVVVRLRELGLDVKLDSFLKAGTIGDVIHDILKVDL